MLGGSPSQRTCASSSEASEAVEPRWWPNASSEVRLASKDARSSAKELRRERVLALLSAPPLRTLSMLARIACGAHAHAASVFLSSGIHECSQQRTAQLCAPAAHAVCVGAHHLAQERETRCNAVTHTCTVRQPQ